MTDKEKIQKALEVASYILDTCTETNQRELRNAARCFIAVLEPDQDVYFEMTREQGLFTENFQ